ncbi:MAG: hypothetical protein AAF639_43935 [Chloroflexota bacterium]
MEAINQVAEGQVAGGQVAEEKVASEQPGELISQETQRFVSAIAKTLQLPVSSSSDGLTQIISYLQQRRLLLILDNFEHVLGANPLLTALVQQALSCSFLVTSRVRLQAIGETIVQVQPLPIAQVSELDTMLMTLPTAPHHQSPQQNTSQEQTSTPQSLIEMLPQTEDYTSIKLFLDYANRHHAQLAIGPSDLATISKLCHLTGGLPLILSMVAAWTEHFTLPQIVSQLEQDSRLFAQTATEQTSTYHPFAYAPGNYHTLDAFFDQSWQLLSISEQGSLSALANFVASFDLGAAQAVVGVNMFDLKRLTDTSLLQVQQIGRYEFHPLIRDYLQEKWEATIADEETHEQIFWEQYCTYFFEVVATYVPQLNGEKASEALANLRREQDHIHLAWRQAITHNFVSLIQATFDLLVKFYNRCSFFKETLALCEHIRQLCEQQPTDSAYQHLLVSVNVAIVETYAQSYQLTEGMALAEVLEKQIMAQTMPIPPDLEMCFHLAYAHIMSETSSITQAIAYLTSAHDKLAGQISPSFSGRYNLFLFRKAVLNGDNEQALGYSEKALTYFQQDDNLWDYASTVYLSVALDKQQKRTQVEQALVLSQRINHIECEAICHSILASCLGLSQHTQRLGYLQKAIALSRSMGNGLNTVNPVSELTAEYIRLGSYAKAEALQRLIVAQTDIDEVASYMMTIHGTMLAFYRGDLDATLHMSQQLVDPQETVGVLVQLLAMFYRGYALMLNDDLTEAQAIFVQLQQMLALIENDFGYERRFVYMALAEVAYRQGDLDHAKTHVAWLLPYLVSIQDHGYYAGEIILIDYFRQHWVCYQVLKALNDARADGVLQSSYEQLQTWADGIEDEELRRSFLENVAVNQMIVDSNSRYQR